MEDNTKEIGIKIENVSWFSYSNSHRCRCCCCSIVTDAAMCYVGTNYPKEMMLSSKPQTYPKDLINATVVGRWTLRNGQPYNLNPVLTGWPYNLDPMRIMTLQVGPGSNKDLVNNTLHELCCSGSLAIVRLSSDLRRLNWLIVGYYRWNLARIEERRDGGGGRERVRGERLIASLLPTPVVAARDKDRWVFNCKDNGGVDKMTDITDITTHATSATQTTQGTQTTHATSGTQTTQTTQGTTLSTTTAVDRNHYRHHHHHRHHRDLDDRRADRWWLISVLIFLVSLL